MLHPYHEIVAVDRIEVGAGLIGLPQLKQLFRIVGHARFVAAPVDVILSVGLCIGYPNATQMNSEG